MLVVDWTAMPSTTSPIVMDTNSSVKVKPLTQRSENCLKLENLLT